MEQAKLEDLVGLISEGDSQPVPSEPKQEMPKPINFEVGKTYDFVDANGKHRGLCVAVFEKGLVFKEVVEVQFLMEVKVGDRIARKVVSFRRSAIDYFFEAE